ncbi:MAG: sortase [Clostridiales bacterium]|nr:sortase [Candidatus Blautia equi]
MKTLKRMATGVLSLTVIACIFLYFILGAAHAAVYDKNFLPLMAGRGYVMTLHERICEDLALDANYYGIEEEDLQQMVPEKAVSAFASDYFAELYKQLTEGTSTLADIHFPTDEIQKSLTDYYSAKLAGDASASIDADAIAAIAKDMAEVAEADVIVLKSQYIEMASKYTANAQAAKWINLYWVFLVAAVVLALIIAMLQRHNLLAKPIVPSFVFLIPSLFFFVFFYQMVHMDLQSYLALGDSGLKQFVDTVLAKVLSTFYVRAGALAALSGFLFVVFSILSMNIRIYKAKNGNWYTESSRAASFGGRRGKHVRKRILQLVMMVVVLAAVVGLAVFSFDKVINSSIMDAITSSVSQKELSEGEISGPVVFNNGSAGDAAVVPEEAQTPEEGIGSNDGITGDGTAGDGTGDGTVIDGAGDGTAAGNETTGDGTGADGTDEEAVDPLSPAGIGLAPPRIAYREQWATVNVDGWEKKDIPVYYADAKDKEALKYGATMAGAYEFCGRGKTVFAAHVTTDFNEIEKTDLGTMIRVDTKYGTFTYKVVDSFIFNQDDKSYLRPDTSKNTLMLYTCYPFENHGAPRTQRLALVADLVSAKLNEE